MAECQILTYAVPDGPPYYINGPMRAVHRCETHGFDLGNYSTELPGGECQCPMGRIERATDEALAKIAAAQKRSNG